MTLDDETTRSVVDLLGIPFVAYVLDITEEEVERRASGCEQELPPGKEDAFKDLVRHAIELGSEAPFGQSPAFPDGSIEIRMRRFGWVDLDYNQTHANLLRLASGGALPEPSTDLDPLERAVATAAIDHFPITLLPIDADRGSFAQRPLIARSRVDALSAALDDDPLGELLLPESSFFTSTGMGYGPLWPFRVGECALVTAEQWARAFGKRSPSDYVDAAVGYLRIMRKLCVTGSCDVPAIIGFWNVEAPEHVALAGPRGARLRPATDADPQVPIAPRATVAVDTVCEVGFSRGALPSHDLSYTRGAERLRLDEQLVCLAGLLSTANDDQRAMPSVAWTHVFDPFQPYVGSFASLPRPPTVPFPRQRLDALQTWISRLDANYDPSIRVAVTRTISAIADTKLSDDALIDLAIALENLVGGPGPKLERRMSTALAVLLGHTTQEKAEVKARAKRVYKARSDLVHGDELPEADAHPQDDAEQLVLEAIATLFTTHTHLIPDRKARRRLWQTAGA
jgi:hypothetical protein